MTFTKPKETLHAQIISLDAGLNFGRNSALYQAIEDWKEAQQEHSNNDIKKTIVFKLPFQSIPRFSDNLLANGLVNAVIELPHNAGDLRQLVLVFEEKTDNAFNRDEVVEAAFDFSAQVRNAAAQPNVNNPQHPRTHQTNANPPTMQQPQTTNFIPTLGNTIQNIFSRGSTTTTTATMATTTMTTTSSLATAPTPNRSNVNTSSALALLDNLSPATKRSRLLGVDYLKILMWRGQFKGGEETLMHHLHELLTKTMAFHSWHLVTVLIKLMRMMFLMMNLLRKLRIKIL